MRESFRHFPEFELNRPYLIKGPILGRMLVRNSLMIIAEVRQTVGSLSAEMVIIQVETKAKHDKNK